MEGRRAPVKADGKPAYLRMMIDSLTRFWLSYVTTPKAADDVAPMYGDAERTAGRAPTLLATDADKTCHEAWKRVLAPQRRLEADVPPLLRARWDTNSKMERFSGTVLDRMRGFKDAESPPLEGMRVHYDRVRPHGGICRLTPGGAAGIKANGRKRKTVIRRARPFRKKNGQGGFRRRAAPGDPGRRGRGAGRRAFRSCAATAPVPAGAAAPATDAWPSGWERRPDPVPAATPRAHDGSGTAGRPAGTRGFRDLDGRHHSTQQFGLCHATECVVCGFGR